MHDFKESFIVVITFVCGVIEALLSTLERNRVKNCRKINNSPKRIHGCSSDNHLKKGFQTEGDTHCHYEGGIKRLRSRPVTKVLPIRSSSTVVGDHHCLEEHFLAFKLVRITFR